MVDLPYTRRYLVRFEPVGRSAVVSSGTTLLDAAAQAGIYLPSACYGQGECWNCDVEIKGGDVSGLTDLEEACLATGNLLPQRRLACCTRVLSDVQVLIPVDSGWRA